MQTKQGRMEMALPPVASLRVAEEGVRAVDAAALRAGALAQVLLEAALAFAARLGERRCEQLQRLLAVVFAVRRRQCQRRLRSLIA